MDELGKNTKQRILECAIKLFAAKGYTETSMRELAKEVGVKEASIYNHFSSKNSILEHILDDYSQFTNAIFKKDSLSPLKENPTAEGILSYLTLIFPEGKEQLYLGELHVILQEQHRNPIVRKFMSEEYIFGNEKTITTMIQDMIEIGIFRPDTDPDFWVKMHSSLIYAFASRSMLGIGDQSEGFSGMGLIDMLRKMYDLMLKTCGLK